MSVKRLKGLVNARTTAGKTVGVVILFIKEKIVNRFESPSVVPTDHGPVFSSAAWKSELKLEGTNARVTASYSPQSNGRTERMVQTNKSAIIQMATDREDKRDELFPVVVNAICAKKRQTKTHTVHMRYCLQLFQKFFCFLSLIQLSLLPSVANNFINT